MSKEAVTRREEFREAVENLTRAVMAKDFTQSRTDREREIREENYVRAVEDFNKATDAFIAPVIRIVEGGVAGQAQEAEGDDKVVCEKCGKDHRCSLACPDWHAAVRNKVESADETYPICEVCDCPNDPNVLCCEKNCPRRADNGLA